MKLVTAPQNEAIMSNVGEIGEFRIRNSAKAFNIFLSVFILFVFNCIEANVVNFIYKQAK